jgi:hypothetical protein
MLEVDDRLRWGWMDARNVQVNQWISHENSEVD